MFEERKRKKKKRFKVKERLDLIPSLDSFFPRIEGNKERTKCIEVTTKRIDSFIFPELFLLLPNVYQSFHSLLPRTCTEEGKVCNRDCSPQLVYVRTLSLSLLLVSFFFFPKREKKEKEKELEGLELSILLFPFFPFFLTFSFLSFCSHSLPSFLLSCPSNRQHSSLCFHSKRLHHSFLIPLIWN